MIIYHQIHKAQPKNFKKNSNTPKIFKDPKNLGLKCMNAFKEKVLGHLLSDLILVEAKNAMGEEI